MFFKFCGRNPEKSRDQILKIYDEIIIFRVFTAKIASSNIIGQPIVRQPPESTIRKQDKNKLGCSLQNNLLIFLINP